MDHTRLHEPQGDSQDGRAGEIRTRGLLVPNRTYRPTVFGSILALDIEISASLLTLKTNTRSQREGTWGETVRLANEAPTPTPVTSVTITGSA